MKMTCRSSLPGLALIAAVAISLPAAIASTARDHGPQAPRDRKPASAQAANGRETELQKMTADGQASVDEIVELASLQEKRGAASLAEQTLNDALRARPRAALHGALAGLYTRQGRQARALETLEQAAALDPTDAALHHTVGTFYVEMSRNPALAEAQKRTLIEKGIAAEDRALQANPEYAEAMVYKNILLRLQANLETDAVLRDGLVAQADALRTRALELMKSRPASAPPPLPPGAAPPPPPPPPPPPSGRKGGDSSW
jgi:Tfp pilus assembly protein PilF